MSKYLYGYDKRSVGLTSEILKDFFLVYIKVSYKMISNKTIDLAQYISLNISRNIFRN